MPTPDRTLTVEEILAYRGGVTNLCRKLLNNYEDARDATQDVMIQAVSQRERFRGDAKVWTWLYRIAVNRCLNLRTREMRKPTPIALDDLAGDEESDTTFLDLRPDPAPDIPDHLSKREAAAVLFAEFGRLPADDLDALALKYHAGMSYLNAAEVMGITVGAYKSRLYRARQRLLERLDHNPVWRERQATD